MRHGICTLESFKKGVNQLAHVNIREKEYILYKDDEYTMILVNTTDGWYVYLFECILNNMELIDKYSFKVNGGN